MVEEKDLAEQVHESSEAVRTGTVDPLDIALTPSYQRLRESEGDIDSKLVIDELLNEILGAKVTRVQELAKVLAAPEVYVKKIEKISTRRISKLIAYHHPVVITHLEYTSLRRTLDRLIDIIDALSQDPPKDPIPKMSGIPDDYVFESEDSIFLEYLEEFAKNIKMNQTLSLDELVMHEDLEEALRRFLFIVVMISRGQLEYDPEDRTVKRVKQVD